MKFSKNRYKTNKIFTLKKIKNRITIRETFIEYCEDINYRYKSLGSRINLLQLGHETSSCLEIN